VAKVEIYSSDWCPFCARAKNLLAKKGVAFEEINVDGNEEARRAMTTRAGGQSTVPQIFIDDELIGGSDELVAMELAGELDKRLTSTA
jgi:glutaredoxin 3